MMKGKLSKLLIIVFAVITMLGICSSIFTVTAAYKNQAKSTGSGLYLTNGSYTSPFYKIVSHDNAYNNFCIKGGATLGSYYWIEFNSRDIYSLTDAEATQYFKSVNDYHSTLWLIDNAYLINTSDAETKAVIKQNLINQMSSQDAKDALNNLSENRINAVEACVFWHLSKNVSAFKDNATLYSNNATTKRYADALFNELLTLARNNNTYVHSNVDTSISALDSFKVDIKTKKCGPFQSNVTLNTSNINIIVNGTTYTSGFSVEKGSDGYYIVAPDGSLKTNAGDINEISIRYKGIKTEASLLTRSGYQNLLSIRKSMISANALAKGTKIPSLDLALVKTIDNIQYDGTHTSYTRFDPDEGVSTANLDSGLSTDADYLVEKDPIKIKKGSTITYRYYIFNEGDSDATAGIVDYVPNGITVSDPNWIKGSSNNGYTKYTYNGTTKKLSSYKKDGNLSYDYIEMECEVEKSSPIQVGEIVTNYAEIVTFTSFSETSTDRDSQPNNVDVPSYIQTTSQITQNENRKGDYDQQDDDDFERIKIVDKEFDLALRKCISKVNDVETGRIPKLMGDSVGLLEAATFMLQGNSTFIYEHSKEVIELHKGDNITYTIRVYSETPYGDYLGLATKIVDNYPAGLKYNAELTTTANKNIDWLSNIQCNESERTVTINAKSNRSDYVLYDVVTAYLDRLLEYDESLHPNYQEVNLVFTVTDSAAYDTNLINTAHIAEYFLQEDKNSKGEVVKADNENIKIGAKQVVDRDSTIANTTTDNSNQIYGHAEDVLASYVKENELYVPGLQDDDDFDTVIIRKYDGQYNFNLQKVEANPTNNVATTNPISDITIKYSDGIYTSEAEAGDNIISKQTSLNGIAKLKENEIIQDSWAMDSSIMGTTIWEAISENNEYIPIAQPIYVYYNFALVNNELRVKNVKVSTTAYKNITTEQFNNLTNSVNVKLMNGSSVKVTIAKSANGNDITLTLPNPPIVGKGAINLLKVDTSYSNPISNVTFLIDKGERTNSSVDIDGVTVKNNSEEVTTNANGLATVNLDLKSTGWSSFTISEVKINRNDASSYLKLDSPLDVYYYTEIVDYQYKITKVGFNDSYNNCVTPGTDETDVDFVYLEGGKLVGVIALCVDKANIVTIKVPNYKINGSYNLNICKVSKSDPDTKVANVKFTGKDANGTDFTATSGTNGIAKLVTGYKIGSTGTDVFTIKEINSVNGYQPLIYNDIKVSVTTGLNSSGTGYVPVSVEAVAVRKPGVNDSKEALAEENMLNEAFKNYPPTISNNTVTVILPNEETSEYSLIINKVDAENNSQFLSTAKFTISGPDGVIVNNKGLENGIANIKVTNVSVGKTYVYTIKENEVPDSLVYKDIFGGAYIKLSITLDENGKIDSSKTKYEIVFPSGISDSEKTRREKEIKAYIHNLEINTSTNEVKLVVENPKYTGDYSLQVVKVGENTSTRLEGVSFKINGVKYTTQNGGVVNYKLNNSTTIPIASSKLSTKDKYTITEINVGDNNYVPLANGLTVYVTKGLIDNERYGVTGISFTESGTSQLNTSISAELQNGEQVTVNASVGNNQLVKITIPNKKITGNYSLKIKKVSSENTSEIVGGAKFTIDSNSTPVTTSSTDGIATLINNKTVNDETTFTHTIEEIEAPSGYRKIEYHKLIAKVTTKVEIKSGIKCYVPSDVAVTAVLKDEYVNVTDANIKEAISKEKTLLSNVSKQISNDVITITIPDQKTTNYNIKLQKIDAEDTTKFLSTAKFEIIGANGETLLNNGSFADGKYTKQESNVDVNKTYTYQIKETQAPEGYKNVFEGTSIKLSVAIDKNGQINQTNTKAEIELDNQNASSTDIANKRQALAPYIEGGLSFDTTTNTVTLNIKNPPILGSYGLKLVKVGESTSTKLANVEFKVAESIYLSSTEKSDINKTVSTKSNGEVAVEDNVEINLGSVNKVDTYTINEIDVGDNAYVSLKNPISVYVTKYKNNDKYEVKGVSFMQNGTPQITASTSAQLTDGTNVTINANVTKVAENNIEKDLITVTIPNNSITGSYNVDILKIDADDANVKVGGIGFSAKDNKNNIYSCTTSASTGIGNLVPNRPIDSERKDVYTISEASVPTGYEKIRYHDIILNVNTIVKTDTSTGNKTYVPSTASFSIKQKATLPDDDADAKNTEYQMLSKAVKVGVNNNTVSVTIPNKKSVKEGKYSLKIKKVDEKNNPINNVTFKVNNTNYSTTNSVANVVTDKAITKDNVTTVDSYAISEVQVGDAYIKLNETVTVYVTKGIINNEYVPTGVGFTATPSIRSEASQQHKLQDGTKVDIVVKLQDGVVTVTIPNKTVEGKYSLKLEKVNKIDKTEKIEDAKFNVSGANGVNITDEATNILGIIKIVENCKITAPGIDTYTITETTAPEYFESIKYHNIIVKVTKERTQNAYNVTKVEWELQENSAAASADRNAVDKEKQMLTDGISVSDDKTTITIPNEKLYDYNLLIKKVDSANSSVFVTNAKFTIDGPNGNILNNQSFTNGQYTYTEEKVHAGSEFTYRIKETEVPSEYKDVFNNLYIDLKVKLNNKGIIDASQTKVTVGSDSSSMQDKIDIANGYIQDLKIANNTVTLVIENPLKKGGYSISLVKKGEGSSEFLKGVQFKVNDGQSKTTNTNGVAYLANNVSITKDNVNVKDKYTITEVSVGSNVYVPLDGAFDIFVAKGIKGDDYGVTGISFTQDGTYSNSITKQLTLKNGKTVTATATVNNNSITITIPNKKPEGNYKLELLKVDSITGQALQGAKFAISSQALGNLTINNSGADGICKIVESDGTTEKTFNITQTGTDVYTISETTNPNGHAKIKYHNIKLTVNKALTSDKTAYEVTRVDISISRNNVDVSNVPEQDVLAEETLLTNGVTYSKNSNTLVLKIPNVPTTSYTLKIDKVDADNNSEFLDTAKFTLKNELGETLVNNAAFTNGQYSQTFSDKVVNKEYVYTLTENDVPVGYEKVFKDVMFEIHINVNKNGAVDTSKSYYDVLCKDRSKTAAQQTAIVQAAKAYVNGLNFEGNTVKLVLKNPKLRTEYKLQLFKHEINSTNPVSGAQFTLYERDESGTYNAIGTYTTPITSSLLEVNNVNPGEQHRYKLVETGIPQGYSAPYSGIDFTVSTDETNNISVEITSITNGNTWMNYNDPKYYDYITATAVGNNINIDFANAFTYKFKLIKNLNTDNATATSFGNARFQVNQLENGERTLHYGELTNNSFEYEQKNVIPNSTYQYIVTELEAPVGFNDILEDVQMLVTINTDSKGNISSTDLKINDLSGLTPSQIQAFNESAKLNVSGDVVTLTVDNYYDNFYMVKLLKTTPDGKPLPNTEFEITKPDSTIYDADPNQSGIQNPKSDADGIINLGYTDASSNKQDAFKITEITPPLGYNKLDGSIIVNIDTYGITDATGIDASRVSLQYMDSDDIIRTLPDGISVNVDIQGRTPIITVTIENEGNEFLFNLKKVDTDGNLISANKVVGNKYDGANFSIDRYILEGDNIPANVGTFAALMTDQVLVNGKFEDSVGAYLNGKYLYRFVETKARSGMVNILEGCVLDVTVQLDSTGKIIRPQADNSGATNFLVRRQGTSEDVTEQFLDSISLNVSTNADGKEVVELQIENPTRYKLKMNKVKTDNSPISSVVLQAYEVNSAGSEDKQYTMSGTSTMLSDEREIRTNETQHWHIYETSIAKPYQNILLTNYVDVTVKNTATGIEIDDWCIRTADGNDIPEFAEMYNYVNVEKVRIDGIDVVNVTITNPTQYDFKVVKLDTEGNQIDCVDLSVERNGVTYKNLGSGGRESSVVVQENYVEIGTIYDYVVKELDVDAPYTNVLEGKHVNVCTEVTSAGSLIVKSFEIISDSDNMPISKNDIAYKYVMMPEVTVDETGKTVVLLRIKNPTEYAYRLIKQDTRENLLGGALLTVKKDNEYIYANDYLSYRSFVENYAEIGDTYQFTIQELSSPAPHANIFKDCAIMFKAEVKAKGEIEVKDISIYDASNNLLDSTNILYYYLNIDVTKNAGIPTIDIKLQNPVQYKFAVQKTYEDFSQSLEGANIQIIEHANQNHINEKTYNTEGASYYELPVQVADIGDGFAYKITELDTVSPHLNIFEGKYIYVEARIDEDEKLTDLKCKIKDIATNDTVDASSDLYNYVSAEIIDGEYETINVKLENPLKYNFQLVKYNTSGNEITDANLKVVRNGEVFENIQNGSRTSNVLIEEKDARLEDEITYEITESNVAAPYVNILKDKVIRIKAKLNNSKKLEVTNVVVRNTKNNKICPTTDEIYNYFSYSIVKDANGFETLRVELKNPYTYKFEFTKTDTNGDKLDNVAFITIHEDGQINSNLNEDSSYAGNISIEQGNVDAGTVNHYEVRELSAKRPYQNILGTKYIDFDAKMNSNGRVTIENYQICNSDGTPNEDESINNYVNVSVNNVDGIDVVNVEIINPISFQLLVKKVDTADNDLRGASIDITTNDIETENNKQLANYYKTISKAKIGDEYEFKIAEKSIDYPYVNVLRNKYILVKTKVGTNGVVAITDYAIYDKSTSTPVKIDEDDDIYNYVNVESVIQGNQVIQVKITNPSEYRFKLVKGNSTGWEINAANLEITRDGETFDNLLNGKKTSMAIVTEDEVKIGDVVTYAIKENSVDGPYVNILTGKTLYVVVKLGDDALPEVIDSYLLDSKGKVSSTQSIEDYLDISSDFVEGYMPEVRVTLKNPFTFNFKLTKTDTNDKEIEGALLKVDKTIDDGETNIYLNDRAANMELTEDRINIGQSVTYKISELNVDYPYADVLNGGYILLKVTVKEDGGLNVDNFKIYEKNGDEVDSSDERYNYVSYVFAKDENNITTVNVRLQNRIMYRVAAKKRTTMDTALTGANYTVQEVDLFDHTHEKGPAYSSNGQSNFALPTQVKDVGALFQYKITEESTVAPHLNVLENKYALVSGSIVNDGSISLTPIQIYNSSDNSKVDESDDVYKYVKAEVKPGMYETIEIAIINPLEYNFKLIKTDTDGNRIDCADLEVSAHGSTFTNDGTSQILINEKNVELKDTCTYIIKETDVDKPYQNILKNKSIVLVTRMNEESKLNVISFFIVGEMGKTVPNTDPLYNFIGYEITEENGVQTVQLRIKNPFTYDFKLTKVDSKGDELNGAILTIEKEETGYTYSNLLQPTCTINETEVKIGETRNYIIKESYTPAPHSNILQGKYILVKATMDENGDVSTEYDIYNSDGTKVDPVSKVRQYVDVYVDDNDIDMVNVKVTNPVKYSLSVHKTDTNGNALSGANIQVTEGRENYYSNGMANYYLPERTANIGEVITYYVREVSTEAPHVNILDGKYIKFNVTITNDEKVFIPDSTFKVCNESDDQEVTDRSIYDQISYKISSVGTENIQIYIENPVEYNFELTKYDTAGNEINCARLEVQKGEKIYNNNGESKVSINERNVKLGDYNSYIIREKDVDAPYTNVLEGKYIEVMTYMNLDSKLENVTFKICDEETGNEVSYMDPARKYISWEITQENGVETYRVKIKNPYEYIFKLSKHDMEDEPLSGVLFRISKDGEIYSNQYEADREFDETTTDINTETTYRITEISAPAPFINMFKGYYIIAKVKMLETGRTESSFVIYNEETDTPVLENDELYDYIRLETTTTDNIDTVNVIVKDPIEFKLNVIKEDTSYVELEGANIKIEVANHEHNTNGNPNYTLLNRGLRIGQEVTYKITETQTVVPHVNILEGKYALLKVKIVKGWTLDIVDLAIYDNETNEEVDKSDNAYKFIEKSILENSEIPTIQVRIKNPVEYDVNVNKSLYGSEGRVSIQDVGINVQSEFSGEHDELTDVYGNVTLTETPVKAGKYEYIFTETKTAGEEFINILDGYYIKVFTDVSARGVVTILNSEGEPEDGKYYIYKQDSEEPIDFEDTCIDEFVKVNVDSTENGKYSLNVNIENPQEFSIRINKENRTKDKKMNDVEFSVKLLNSELEDVTLRNSKELDKTIDTESMITKTVDGVDGVIQIDNILIEKAGEYTLLLKEKLTEEQALKFQDAGFISIKFNVVEADGRYVIKDITPFEGKYYVKDAYFGTQEEAEDVIDLEQLVVDISNEELSGEYKFDIVKIDDYSNKLENIEFTVNELECSTDSDGLIKLKVDLEDKGKGWDKDVITEIDNTKNTNNEDYVKIDSFEIYRYTDIVDNKFVVTKIGFSDKEGEYVEVPKEGNISISKEISTENPNVKVTVVVMIYAAEDGIVRTEIVIPNPEVTGKYNLEIAKIDQDKKPVQGVTFKVNNEETKPTGFDGKVNIAEKDVTEAGIDTYKITEVKASAEYYTLKDAITINVKTERENGEFVITKAYFDNDEKATTKKAMLEDGKTEVELTITYKDDVVTLTVPNRKVIFDLALVKYVTGAAVTEKTNGKLVNRYVQVENAEESDDVLKVDLGKANLKDVTVKFNYTIKVTNEGEIAGYVKEISDYIPEGLKFVESDNTKYNWKQSTEDKVVTDYLKDTELQPGESASVEIVLTWINGENNLGLKINVAEISKDYNQKDDIPDIDSTPDNEVPGEDDIDSAQVILAIQTGEASYGAYVTLGIAVIAIIGLGIVGIKKVVLDKKV